MSDKISYVTLCRYRVPFAALGLCLRRLGLALILLLVLCSCSSEPTKSADSAQPPHILVLGLDGISYSTFKKLQDGGHFRNFNTVAPMIASFPSISDPNWDQLFGLGPEPGYTKAFFDPTIKTKSGVGKENGSILAHFSREPQYERAVDFKADGALEHLSTFIWTETTGKYWLESLESSFFSFSKPNRKAFFSLIINTDLLSHTEGEMSLMQFLEQVEERVYKIQARYKAQYNKDLEVVIMSDHGNGYFKPKDIPFEENLKRVGWSLKDTLSRGNEYGFFVPEILSFGAFYCLPDSSRKLALDLARVERVHSSMYVGPRGEIHVFGQGGQAEALISYDPSKRSLKYKVIRGSDPLNQNHYFGRKKSLSADDYFLKTVDDTYPNALMRIWEAFNVNSKTKPQVLVNPVLGSVFGNTTLRLLTDLRGFASCHGSLHRDESDGIFVSTRREFPPVRPQDVRKYLPVEELKQELKATL